MKTMKFTSKLFMVLLTTVFFIACSGEDGVDGINGLNGIDGADGADGADGTDGADGAQGEQGETGTANVIFSDWIDSEFETNIASSAAGIDLEAESLTQEIIDQGTVLVYGRNIVLPSNEIFPLPQIISNDNHGFRISEVGSIRLTIVSLSGGAIGSRIFEDYRYVLIPGGQREGGNGGGDISSRRLNIDFTKMTYQEIIDFFNIPE